MRRHVVYESHLELARLLLADSNSRVGMDLSAIPRMSAENVVDAALSGIRLGEVVSAPGAEYYNLHQTVFDAELAAFGGTKRSRLASRNLVN